MSKRSDEIVSSHVGNNAFSQHVDGCKICKHVVLAREAIDAPYGDLCNAGHEALDVACDELARALEPTLN